MKLIYNETYKRWECLCLFDERFVPKKAGFLWDATTKKWWTTLLANALKLKEHASSECRAMFNLIDKEKEEKLNESNASNSEIEIPVPEGLSYLPFQKAGINFLTKRENVLLADEMGLGKTVMVLGYINDTNPNNILIVCPASLKLNWKREAEKWLINLYLVDIAKDTFPNTNIVVINYDLLHKFSNEIRQRKWDLLVCDESHYIKNWKAQRTKEVIGSRGKLPPIPATKKIFLTGTPILNKPIEIWTTCNFLAPKEFGKFWDFAENYCAMKRTKFGHDLEGASNLDDLNEKLRTTIMIRRLKKDVMKELPPKRRQIVELPTNGCEKIIEEERKAWIQKKEQLEYLRKEIEQIEIEKNKELYKEKVAELRTAKMVAFSEISALRHKTAVTKIPYVIDFLHDIMESEEKIIFFAHHRDVLMAIHNEFKNNSMLLIGEMKSEDRQQSVDRFQNDPNIKLFIGSLHAAGMGITLTASSHVVFAELDWTPAIMTQAEDRCHRIGTQEKEYVLIQHLVFDGSLDANIAKKLIEKQEIIDKALGDNNKIDLDLL